MRRLVVILLAVIAATTGAVVLIATLLGGVVAQLQTARPAEFEDADLGIVQRYEVQPDATLEPSPEASVVEVWDDFVAIATPEVAGSLITHLDVGDSESSDTAAYVLNDGDDSWTLAVNLAAEDDMVPTLIHEYAHLLSLGADDVEPRTACRTLAVSEGCLVADAPLLAFSERFWSGYGDEAPDPENVDGEQALMFYQRHKEDFVSDYAATNVVEDYAESFMTYVLEADLDGDSVVGEKLRFFAAYPDVVSARDRIREAFGL